MDAGPLDKVIAALLFMGLAAMLVVALIWYTTNGVM